MNYTFVRKNIWLLIIIIIVGVIYFNALAFDYVDGNDASSIAYHLFGRNSSFQPAYAPYHGMADTFLKLLPANEPLLRISSIVTTVLGTLGTLFFAMLLVFDWAGIENQHARWQITGIVFLTVPELFYLGLVYSPTMIAMSLILAAHTIIRSAVVSSRNYSALKFKHVLQYILSVGLFGLGVSFEWGMAVYIVIVVIDLLSLRIKLFDTHPHLALIKYLFVALWGISVAVISIELIIVSGYSLEEIVRQLAANFYVFQHGLSLTFAQTGSWQVAGLQSMLSLSSAVSPALILLVVIGLISMIRNRSPYLWLVAGSFLVTLLRLQQIRFKSIIVFLPALVLCSVYGVVYIRDHLFTRAQKIVVYSLGALLLLFPWVIGIRILSMETAWGPDFAIQPQSNAISQGSKLEFVLGPGGYYSTPDGPRALYGHAYLILGGRWKQFVVEEAREREDALSRAKALNYPLLITGRFSEFYLNDLYAQQYITNDAYDHLSTDSYFFERKFFHADKSEVTILIHQLDQENIDEFLKHLILLKSKYGGVVFVGEPATVRSFYQDFPDVTTSLGSHSAIIRFEDLTADSVVDEGKVVTVAPVEIDDYLPNPGIGWQHDENPLSSSFLPETVSYATRSDVSWKMLNPYEDTYNWAALDNKLSRAVSNGKQLSFRIYTMRGSSFGGHQIPDWVLDKGAKILSSGEPDYSNCVYQAEWGKFVEALRLRYDGNPNIAFIDISGYGDFNEWGWTDTQTEWDYAWEDAYLQGLPDQTKILTVDGQARRRLADMFIGGSADSHKCREENGLTQEIQYSYEGFQKTQLIMPFAGITQSTQYVFVKRPDVGFRHDCLGRPSSETIPVELGQEISAIWPKAPIVYEFCSPGQVELAVSEELLDLTHGSIVHNNEFEYSKNRLVDIMKDVGYRYYLKEARISSNFHPGDIVLFSMKWQNVGMAPNYPKLGQNFKLYIYLENGRNTVLNVPVSTDISKWMPSESFPGIAPDNQIDTAFELPASLAAENYAVKVAIIDERTGQPVNLAMEGRDSAGRYFLSDITITENGVAKESGNQ